MLPARASESLLRFAQAIERNLRRADATLVRRPILDTRHRKALSLITTGAAARLALAGRSPDDFFEQVAYNSRRLAKLNVPPLDVVQALREYDDRLAPALDGHSGLNAVLQSLHFRTLLAMNNAYYQVREAETQAFYGLLRAEMEAAGLEDLLHRFILILTRTFRAHSGRLIPLTGESPLPAAIRRSLAKPRYIVAGSPAEKLILDPAMRRCQSYWSIPYFAGGVLAGLVQFGFPTPYRWLPRELDLLHAFAERCLQAAGRTRLVLDLATREEQVRTLASRLFEAEHEERSRISRELHDDAGQSMLFLRLHLEMLEKSAPAALQPKLAEARKVAEGIIAEIRRIVAALRPSVVDELGLPSAIRHLSARFRTLYPIKLQTSLTPYSAGPHHAAEATLYRVVQECYQNIAKHSAASRVNLSLKSTDKSLELNIADNGAGFDVDSAMARPKSFGLKGMRERVSLLGGRLEIRTSPGNGTTVSVHIPIPLPS